MPVKLYYLVRSPPARAVELVLKMLGISYELINVDLSRGENRSEEFIKLNPQHTIPVIVDEDGFAVSDSHAINAYLVGKYAKDDKLYPKDLKARSVVDHRLYFDCGTLFHCLKAVSFAFFIERSINSVTEPLRNRFEDVYESLERYLSSTRYIAADHLTIADFSILTTLASARLFVPVERETYPNLLAYIQRGDDVIPFLKERNEAGIESTRRLYKEFNFRA